MDNPILSAAVPTLLVHGGVFLVAGVLPFFAFFIVDGLVAVVRGRGLLPLLFAAGMVGAIAVGGSLAWQAGLEQFAGTPAFSAMKNSADANAALFAGWAIAIGAIAFLFRMINLMTRRRKGAQAARR